MDWEIVDQAMIWEPNIEYIPKQHIDLNEVLYPEAATTEQMMYDSNIEDISFGELINSGNFIDVVAEMFVMWITGAEPDGGDGIHMREGSEGGSDSLEDLEYFDFHYQEESNLVMPFPIADNPIDYSVGDNGINYFQGGLFKDSDKDGLTDEFEENNGMSANMKDTDGDGLTDYDEFMTYPTDERRYNTYPEAGLVNDKVYIENLLMGNIDALILK